MRAACLACLIKFAHETKTGSGNVRRVPSPRQDNEQLRVTRLLIPQARLRLSALLVGQPQVFVSQPGYHPAPGRPLQKT